MFALLFGATSDAEMALVSLVFSHQRGSWRFIYRFVVWITGDAVQEVTAVDVS